MQKTWRTDCTFHELINEKGLAHRTSIIGITGGIGSGKSYVAHLLSQHFGIPVYDTDSQARRLMVESPQVRSELIQLLGSEAYTKQGELQKAVVARYLFASSEHAARINAIVHPAVKSDFLLWASAQDRVVAIESAILLEAGFRDIVDCLVVVTAPMNLRIQRAMLRDGVGEEQVRQRMAQQISEQERLQAADYIINNDGRDLFPLLQILVEKYLS